MTNPKSKKPKTKSQETDAMGMTSVRLDADIMTRLDDLAIKLAPLGAKPSRSIAARAAILTGLPLLETEYSKSKARKP